MSETVTETRLEAVERELAVCSNCEQPTEDEDAVTVGVDLREVEYRNGTKQKPVDQHVLCEHCAEAVFGYERGSTIMGEKALPIYIQARRAMPAGFFAKIGYGVTVGATLLLLGFLLGLS